MMQPTAMNGRRSGRGRKSRLARESIVIAPRPCQFHPRRPRPVGDSRSANVSPPPILGRSVRGRGARRLLRRLWPTSAWQRNAFCECSLNGRSPFGRSAAGEDSCRRCIVQATRAHGGRVRSRSVPPVVAPEVSPAPLIPDAVAASRTTAARACMAFGSRERCVVPKPEAATGAAGP